MKLADLLGTVANVPLSQFPWAPPLVAALNEGVQEHMKVDLALTGSEMVARLFARGSTASTLLSADYDLGTGALNLTPDPIPVMTTPAVAVPVVSVTPVAAPGQWSANKVIASVAGGLILLLSLAMVGMSFSGKEINPDQARVVEKAIDKLGDVANRAMDDERRQNQPPPQHSPGPFDPQQPGSLPYPPPQQTMPQYPQ